MEVKDKKLTPQELKEKDEQDRIKREELKAANKVKWEARQKAKHEKADKPNTVVIEKNAPETTMTIRLVESLDSLLIVARCKAGGRFSVINEETNRRFIKRTEDIQDSINQLNKDIAKATKEKYWEPREYVEMNEAIKKKKEQDAEEQAKINAAANGKAAEERVSSQATVKSGKGKVTVLEQHPHHETAPEQEPIPAVSA